LELYVHENKEKVKDRRKETMAKEDDLNDKLKDVEDINLRIAAVKDNISTKLRKVNEYQRYKTFLMGLKPDFQKKSEKAFKEKK
jgi:hypothetical protein